MAEAKIQAFITWNNRLLVYKKLILLRTEQPLHRSGYFILFYSILINTFPGERVGGEGGNRRASLTKTSKLVRGQGIPCADSHMSGLRMKTSLLGSENHFLAPLTGLGASQDGQHTSTHLPTPSCMRMLEVGASSGWLMDPVGWTSHLEHKPMPMITFFVLIQIMQFLLVKNVKNPSSTFTQTSLWLCKYWKRCGSEAQGETSRMKIIQ